MAARINFFLHSIYQSSCSRLFNHGFPQQHSLESRQSRLQAHHLQQAVPTLLTLCSLVPHASSEAVPAAPPLGTVSPALHYCSSCPGTNSFTLMNSRGFMLIGTMSMVQRLIFLLSHHQGHTVIPFPLSWCLLEDRNQVWQSFFHFLVQ